MAANGEEWDEVRRARQENRRELVLAGESIDSKISKNNGTIDENVYSLSSLNFLEVRDTCLSVLSDDLARLEKLTNLVIFNNKLQHIPSSIGQLKCLKYLDLSRNEITEFPEEVKGLVSLETLNVSTNHLVGMPELEDLSQLHILNLSHNELVSFPETIVRQNLTLLNTINLKGNALTNVPDNLDILPALKALDLSDNKITEVPAKLSDCHRLKELDLRGNKFKDRRLGKMTEQCSTKAMLDYLRGILAKEQGGKGKSKKEAKKKSKKDQGESAEDVAKNIINVIYFPEDGGMTVQIKEPLADIRPFIVCCIVRNLDFKKSVNMFKHFITLQTKLHDTLCDKRQVATIATHDLKSVRRPLCYDARNPKTMKLTPLFKSKEVTGEELVNKLHFEAEEYRKEKKRNTVSGIHKYITLVRGKPLYPCLVDAENVIISFPPITNCEATKVSKDTTDILIEVTSSTNLDVCKKILDELLYGMLNMGVGRNAEEDNAGATGGGEGEPKSQLSLTVEQVRILDTEGGIKVVYPSRTDLQSPEVNVIRQ